MLTKFEKRLNSDLERILDLEYNDVPLSRKQLILYLEGWKRSLEHMEGEEV